MWRAQAQPGAFRHLGDPDEPGSAGSIPAPTAYAPNGHNRIAHTHCLSPCAEQQDGEGGFGETTPFNPCIGGIEANRCHAVAMEASAHCTRMTGNEELWLEPRHQIA